MAQQSSTDFEVWYANGLGPATADNKLTTTGTFETWYTNGLGPAELIRLAFPHTPILDTFTRANEATLLSPWTSSPKWGSNGLELASNQIKKPTVPSSAGSYWSGRSWDGQRMEMYATVAVAPTLNAEYFHLEIVRSLGSLSAIDGYVWLIRGDASTAVYRFTAGGASGISGIITMPLAAGDGVGMSYDQDLNLLKGWKRSGASGAWVEQFSISDSTHNGPWYLQFGLTATTQLDDVGGGVDEPPKFSTGLAGGLLADDRFTVVTRHGGVVALALRGGGRLDTTEVRTGTAVVGLRGPLRVGTLATKAIAYVAALRTASRAAAPGSQEYIAAAALRAALRGSLVARAIVAQLVGPLSDLSDGGWTNELGSTSNLYASLDELSASDADYVQSSPSPLAVDEVKLTLATLADPAVDTDHTLRYRYQKDLTGGDHLTLVVRLYRADGVTVIAERTHADIDAITDGVLTLSTVEAASIPSGDYSLGLVLGLRAVVS